MDRFMINLWWVRYFVTAHNLGRIVRKTRSSSHKIRECARPLKNMYMRYVSVCVWLKSTNILRQSIRVDEALGRVWHTSVARNLDLDGHDTVRCRTWCLRRIHWHRARGNDNYCPHSRECESHVSAKSKTSSHQLKVDWVLVEPTS